MFVGWRLRADVDGVPRALADGALPVERREDADLEDSDLDEEEWEPEDRDLEDVDPRDVDLPSLLLEPGIR